jgi:hypothetical protein
MLVISEPSITVPLMLSNTMTNMGEMTSICEMWDGGYDYTANINLDADEMDYSGGVLVHYNNDNWILKSYYGGPGYLYSEKYKEIYFANKSGMTSEEYLRFAVEDNEVTYAEQWERYLDYIPQIEKEILNNYAYKGNQLVLNPNPLVMSNKYEIYTNDGKGYCVKNSIICLIFTCEYIEVGKKNYEIFYVFEKVNPYITYDGDRVYLTINNNEAIIKSKQICSKFTQKYTVRSGNCYYYGDTLYIKDESIFIDGYANINNNDIYFAYEGGVLKEKTFNGIYKIGEFCKDLSLKDETFLGYTTFKDNTTELSYVQYVTPYTKYNGKYVIGETSSRLDEFTDELNIASDNLGNRFDGLMPYKTITVGNKTYPTYVTNPAPNDWLSIKFRPQFTVDMDEDGDNYYGNIIEKVVFTWQESSAVTSAATTQSEMIKIEQYLHSGISANKVSDISMTVTYYIGTLVQKNASGYTLFNNSGKTPYYGIKYTETFSLSPSQCLYHYDDVNSCILNYFRLEGNTKPYAMDRYNAVGSETNIATFEYVIKPFDLQYGFIDLSSGNNTFYRVNEFDETIELSGKTYPLEFEGSRKYFSFGVEKNASLYDGYLYYCIKDGVKFYATKIMSGSNTNYEFKFTPDDVYSTNGSNNNFTKDEEALTNQVYCLVPIKMYLVTSPGTFDPYFDYSNNTTISPLIFDENKLGFAMQEKIVENIYNIDRGTVRAMDFHLRLLESKSLESLEQIGNGFFKFNAQ